MLNIDELSQEDARLKLYFILHSLGKAIGYSSYFADKGKRTNDAELYKVSKKRKLILSQIMKEDFAMTDEEVENFVKEWNY